MSYELIEALTKVMSVIAGCRQGDKLLNDGRVCQGKIDTCLIETDSTDSVGDGAGNLKSVSGQTLSAHIMGCRVFLFQLCVQSLR